MNQNVFFFEGTGVSNFFGNFKISGATNPENSEKKLIAKITIVLKTEHILRWWIFAWHQNWRNHLIIKEYSVFLNSWSVLIIFYIIKLVSWFQRNWISHDYTSIDGCPQGVQKIIKHVLSRAKIKRENSIRFKNITNQDNSYKTSAHFRNRFSCSQPVSINSLKHEDTKKISK